MLGDVLLDDGHVTADELASALDEQRRHGRSLGRVLVERGTLTEQQLVAAKAVQIGLRFVELSDFPVDVAAVVRVSEAVCRRHSALPIGYEDGRLLVAMADPANVLALDDIRSRTGREVRPLVATRTDVLAALDRHSRAGAELDDLSAALELPAPPEVPGQASSDVEDAPIVRFVDLLIAQAVQDRASDIHLEPTERDLRVRFRIDGVLHERIVRRAGSARAWPAV